MKSFLTFIFFLTINIDATSQSIVENDTSTESRPIYILERAPNPKVSISKYYKWINQNNPLINSSDTLTINHKVFIEFLVNKVGGVDNCHIIHGLGQPYDSVAIKLICNNPIEWSPGTQSGNAVDVKMILAITFVDIKTHSKGRLKAK